jgi:diaminopimelate epimerase
VGIPFLKGHGTENDFVLLPDLDASLELTEARVRVLCDRRAGLGADGVLRVVRAKAIPDRPSDVDDDVWFMDYRNGDGSLAEMCGNGARVFARYLVEAGLETRTEFPVGTRAGTRPVVVRGGEVAVEMGPAKVTGESAATIAGRTIHGIAVDVGNPHLVCAVDRLDDLDLTRPPGHDPAVFPDGVNVEFVVVEAPDRISMRVHERGVGETRSCGTGTVAVVAGVLHGAGRRRGAATVTIPGGCVRVEIGDATSVLTGPAVFVARGELDRAWWDGIAG